MIVFVSACLLSSAAMASSASVTMPMNATIIERTAPTTAPRHTVVALKSRAEVFLGVSLKSIELLDVNPVNATRYYDQYGEAVLECIVAPVSAPTFAEGASTAIRIEGNRVYALMPSNGGTGPNRWMRMNGGGSGNTTRLGVPRDNPGAWRDMRDLWDQTDHGGILSPANRTRIQDGLTPHVDDHWIQWFPGDAHLKGELIPMHHIQGTPIVVPLPATRHLDAHMPGGFRFNPGGPGTSG